MSAVPRMSRDEYAASIRHTPTLTLAGNPVDEPDLLTLIADEQTVLGKPFADAFRDACEADARANDGWVHPSRVNARLHAVVGDFDPRRFSAMWAPACGRDGFLDKTDVLSPIDPANSRGNGGKSVRLRRFRGVGGVSTHPVSAENDYLGDAVEAVLLADSRRTEPIPLALADALDQLRRCRYGTRQPVPADATLPPGITDGAR